MNEFINELPCLGYLDIMHHFKMWAIVLVIGLQNASYLCYLTALSPGHINLSISLI